MKKLLINNFVYNIIMDISEYIDKKLNTLDKKTKRTIIDKLYNKCQILKEEQKKNDVLEYYKNKMLKFSENKTLRTLTNKMKLNKYTYDKHICDHSDYERLFEYIVFKFSNKFVLTFEFDGDLENHGDMCISIGISNNKSDIHKLYFESEDESLKSYNKKTLKFVFNKIELENVTYNEFEKYIRHIFDNKYNEKD